MATDENKKYKPRVGWLGFLIGLILLVGAMFGAFVEAEEGWGYIGSSGYESGPSWFYWDDHGSSFYYGGSSSGGRAGSVGGANINGRGPHGGK